MVVVVLLKYWDIGACCILSLKDRRWTLPVIACHWTTRVSLGRGSRATTAHARAKLKVAQKVCTRAQENICKGTKEKKGAERPRMPL